MTEQVQQLDVGNIKPSSTNRAIGDVKELAASIKAQGVLVPIVVRPNGEGFELVYGERRWTAAKIAGLETVPAIVREIDDEAALEIQLVENLQRKDIEPLEEAAGYARLRDHHAMPQSDIAKRVGRSDAHISKRLQLLELPDVAKDALSTGKVTLEEAFELRRLRDVPEELVAIAVKEIASDGAGGWKSDTKSIVDEQIREHEYIGIREALTQRLSAEKCKLIERPRNIYSAKEKPITAGYDSLGLSKGQHKKEPCHAAWLEETIYSKPKVVYVCTDPSRHTKKGESSLKLETKTAAGHTKPKETAADRKRKAEDKARRDASAARRSFAAGLTKAKALSSAETLEVLAQGVVDRALYDAQNIAIELLDIEVEGKHRDVRGALDRFIKEKPDNLRRAAIALSFANDELGFRSGYTYGQPSQLVYLERLARHGHDLTDVETQAIADIRERLQDELEDADA